MTYQLLLFGLAITGLSLAARAQSPTTTPLQIRAVLHDPLQPEATLFYTDKTGAIVPLEFRPQDLTRPLTTVPINGTLVLYDKLDVDPKDPAASIAASVKLPPGLKRAMILVVPSSPGKTPAYRMLVIDDSAEAFPKGESRVVPLLGEEIAIQAGEHKLLVQPGKIGRVPPVNKVNDFNMAQTNFYVKHAESWVAFTERQLQYLDVCRRLFIVHITPGALAPTVTTIVDTGSI